MSAFVCDNKTINRIVAGLDRAMNMGGWGRHLPEPSKELAEMIGDDLAEFGKTLYLMNINAVEQRYPDCVGHPDNLPGQCDPNGHHVPYKYQFMGSPERYQLHKTLNCFLYQCSEGDVDELPLYKLLRDYLQSLANHIVTTSQQWENAEWG